MMATKDEGSNELCDSNDEVEERYAIPYVARWLVVLISETKINVAHAFPMYRYDWPMIMS